MRVCDVLERVAGLSVSSLDDAGLRGALGELQLVKARVAALEAPLVAELARRGGRGSWADTLGRIEAGRLERRAELLEAVPGLADALASGEVGVGQVDALAAVAQQSPLLDEHGDELIGLARNGSPERVRERARLAVNRWAEDAGIGRFERQRAQVRLVRRIDDITGMHQFRLDLDPERAAFLTAVINQRVEERFHTGEWAHLTNDQRGALALYQLATTSGSGERRASVTVNVMIDERTLIDGLHAHSRIDLDGGGTLPVETIRRLGCEAQILPIVLGGPSGIIDVGRAQRMATPRQRAALHALHPTCGVPGCTVPYEHCNIHHIHWWQRGGRTDLDNMVPLCNQHHHDVHERGHTITLGPQRTITWTPP